MRFVVSNLLYVPLVLLFCLLWSRTVLPHAGLAVTCPDHDEFLRESPAKIIFQFMATMRLTNIRLEISTGDEAGQRIDVRLPRDSIGQSTAVGETIALDLPPLQPATYLITWQAAALDGQILLDDVSFTVIGP